MTHALVDDLVLATGNSTADRDRAFAWFLNASDHLEAFLIDALVSLTNLARKATTQGDVEFVTYWADVFTRMPDLPQSFRHLRDLVEPLRLAVREAEARYEESMRVSDELVVLDVPKQRPLRLKGRIRSVRPGSNEHCLTADQVRTILADGDDD